MVDCIVKHVCIQEGKTPKELASDHNHTLTESMLNKTRAQVHTAIATSKSYSSLFFHVQLSKLRSFKQEDPQPQVFTNYTCIEH